MTRKLLIALAAAALYAGVLVATASAQEHKLLVTLVTGQQLVITADVPDGTPASSISIPGLPAPVKSVQDLGPVSTPTATPTAPPVTVTPTPSAPSPTPSATRTPAPARGGGAGSGGSGSRPGGSGGSGGSGAKPGAGKDGAAKRDRSSRARGDKGSGSANTQSGSGRVQPSAGKGSKQKDTPAPPQAPTTPGGAPTPADPSFTLATPGAARIGVPNFFIDKFRIPPFLLPIYQAAGTQYGVRWELLAAINEIETDYGRNLNVSSAGAVGWMQFLPATWKMYGVDANGDGEKDPFNPVDAIFGAARYLRAAGADKDIRGAVFAYNHADWYVDSVLLRARLIGGLPSNLVGSLTGLTQGRFPVHAKATYADSLSRAELKAKRKGNAALVVDGSRHRRNIDIFAKAGSPVVAVNDARVVRIGRSKRLGRFIQIQDVYGNTFTYGRLGKIVRRYPAPKPADISPAQIRHELELPRDAKPTAAASDTKRPARKAPSRKLARKAAPSGHRAATEKSPVATKQRLFAHPQRAAAARVGGADQEFRRTGLVDGVAALPGSPVFGLDRSQVVVRRLRAGSQLAAGTILGRIGKAKRGGEAAHLVFEIRPAGRGAPRIDPKPILDGWKLLESTAIYRAKGENPFFGRDAATPSIGQILLMGKEQLQQRVLADPRITLYNCGRRDVQSGQIDRRVLATLEFLVASGFEPTVSSLHCGHSYLTSSGNVSEHSSGNAVDIAKVNGIPIVGHQGKGSITELVIQRLLTLQGTMKPDQIISLMTFEGADNTLALPDHADHIHIGWKPLYGTDSKLAKQVNAILKPKQWIKLIDRLGSIENPKVRVAPSKYALATEPAVAATHSGD